MIAAIVAPLAAGDPALYTSLAVSLAVLTGLACACAGLFRLGFLADFLGKPVLVGFMNGIAISIVLGQIGKVFGFPIESSRVLPRLFEFASKLPRTHLPTLAVGVVTFVVLRALAASVLVCPRPSSPSSSPSRWSSRSTSTKLASPSLGPCRGAAVARVDASTGGAFRAVARRRLRTGAGEFHERDGDRAELCHPQPLRRRRRPRVHRTRGVQCGRGPVARLCRDRRRLTHGGERRDGRQDTSDRARRGGRDCDPPALFTRSPPLSAWQRARRRVDFRGVLAVRRRAVRRLYRIQDGEFLVCVAATLGVRDARRAAGDRTFRRAGACWCCWCLSRPADAVLGRRTDSRASMMWRGTKARRPCRGW